MYIGPQRDLVDQRSQQCCGTLFRRRLLSDNAHDIDPRTCDSRSFLCSTLTLVICSISWLARFYVPSCEPENYES